jgi:hypothetical protein
MLDTPITCTSSCRLREVCHSSVGRSLELSTFVHTFRNYCRHTRRLVMIAFAAPAIAAAAMGIAGILK